MQAINIFDPIPHVAPPRLMPLVAMAREQPAWTHYASPEPELPVDIEPLPGTGTATGELIKLDSWSPEMQRYWAKRFPRPALHSQLLMPAYVVTGPLSRPPAEDQVLGLTGVIPLAYQLHVAAVEREERLISTERPAFVAAALDSRPDGIDAEAWRELMNQALRLSTGLGYERRPLGAAELGRELERLAGEAGLTWKAPTLPQDAPAAADGGAESESAPGANVVAALEDSEERDPVNGQLVSARVGTAGAG